MYAVHRKQFMPIGSRLGKGTSFAARSDLEQALALGWRLPNGEVVTAAGLSYQFDNTAGDPIADMPGVVIIGGSLRDDMVINIPTNFQTLQAARDATAAIDPAGHKIILRGAAGHQWTAGVVFENSPAGHYRIEHADGRGFVTSNFVGVHPTVAISGSNVPSAVVIVGVVGPEIACIFDGTNLRPPSSNPDYAFEERRGLFSIRRGSVGISNNGGFENFTGQGGHIREKGVINGRGSRWNGNGKEAMQVTTKSEGQLANSQFNGAWWNTLNPSNDQTAAAVSFSRGSSGTLQDAQVNDSGRYGVDSRRSELTANGAEILNSAGPNLIARNSGYISADGVNLGETGVIRLRDGGGIIHLGQNSIYGSIIKGNGGDIVTIPANLPTNFGVVFESGSQGFVTMGNVNEGYRVFPDGWCEMWKAFEFVPDDPMDYLNLSITVAAPVRLTAAYNTDFSNGSICTAGVTFNGGGSGIGNQILQIYSRTIVGFQTSPSISDFGGWTIRHPWTGVNSESTMRGVLWAKGFIHPSMGVDNGFSGEGPRA